MTKKIYLAGSAFFILIVIGFSVKTDKSANDRMLKVESVPLHNASGWGYEILVDHKIFIHQECIPSVAGKMHLASKKTAMKCRISDRKNSKRGTASHNKK